MKIRNYPVSEIVCIRSTSRKDEDWGTSTRDSRSQTFVPFQARWSVYIPSIKSSSYSCTPSSQQKANTNEYFQSFRNPCLEFFSSCMNFSNSIAYHAFLFYSRAYVNGGRGMLIEARGESKLRLADICFSLKEVLLTPSKCDRWTINQLVSISVFSEDLTRASNNVPRSPTKAPPN